MQELAVDNTAGKGPPNDQGPRMRVVLKFLSLWLGSLVILVCIALLSNIEWARRHIATALCQSFHRNVTLGRLAWSFGLQGLSIDTDRLEIRDRDGGPFIIAGKSEIGIAFLPLLQQKLVVKHLQFNKPEVWAVRFDEKNWNFSDLMTEGPEIHMLQIENGVLHLRNFKHAHKIAQSTTVERTIPVAFSSEPPDLNDVPVKKYDTRDDVEGVSNKTAPAQHSTEANTKAPSEKLLKAEKIRSEKSAIEEEHAKNHVAGRTTEAEHEILNSAAAEETADWNEYTLRNIKLSVTFPKGKRNWPLYASFKVPFKDAKAGSYDTGVTLFATGSGAYEDWQKNKYKIDLRLEKFDPSKFRPFLSNLPPVRGISNLEIKGEGIFNEGFIARAKGDVDALVIPTGKEKDLELDHSKISSMLIIDPKIFKWEDLRVLLGKWELESSGQLENWQKRNNHYQARVGGKLNDLSGFFNKVVSKFVPGNTKTTETASTSDAKLPGGVKTKEGKLAGSATIELHLAGDEKQQNIATNIKANGVPLTELVESGKGGKFLESLNIDPSAPITGELKIDQNKKITLKDIEIPMDDTSVKLSGYIDEANNKTEIDFQSDKLGFETFKKRIGSENDVLKAITGGKGKSRPLVIAGRMNVKGNYKLIDGKQSLLIDSKLDNMSFSNETGVIFSNVSGEIDYDGDRVKVSQLKGRIPAGADKTPGDIFVDGQFDGGNAGRYRLDIKGHDLVVAQLKDWLTRFGMKLPVAYTERLGGEIRELKAHIDGTQSRYNVNFSMNPNELVVMMPGRVNESTSQQFRFSSGLINYANNQLNMKDVVVTSRGGKMTVSGDLSGALDSLKIKQVRIRSEGFEIADLQGVFKTSATPLTRTKKANTAPLADLLVPSSGSSLHGKVYGDMYILQAGADVNVDGVVGFHNAGGRFGSSGMQVEKLTGLAAISKSQIVLQDTSGQLGQSSFSLDGVISNYKTPNYTWEGQLRGQFFPDEVERLVDNLGHGIEVASVSNDAISLRVSGSGDNDKADVRFRGRAKKGQGLYLKTAFGTFTQPKGYPLFFNGAMNVNQETSQLQLPDFNIISGDDAQHGDLLHGSGMFQWASETAEKPASIAFSLNTPQPVKLATIAEITGQKPRSGASTEIGGFSQVNMKIEGPVNDLVLNGSVALEKVSLPGIHMDNLTGRLDLPNWHLNRADKEAATSSTAKLTVNNMSFGGLYIKDANASLSLDSAKGIVMRDGQAQVAGGKLTMKGFFNPQDQTYHSDINISKLIVDQFVKDVMDNSSGVTGLADLSLSLDGENEGATIIGNKAGEQWFKNMNGTGKFSIYQGSVANFGKLQEKLNAANFIQQGLFGFNVNNLLQAMMPVNSGQFNEISGKIAIGQGKIDFDEVRFDGENLRMRAAGKFDAVNHKIDFDVAGNVPRVSSSIIPGAIGDMSRKITLQRMFRIVTFRKLKDLPALPLIGDIANDDPRAFRFEVLASADNQKLITQSVEKSFKWLPNRPLASPHPVPGM